MKSKILLGFMLLTATSYGMRMPDSVELDLSGSYGLLDGFIQIPKGGMHGSSANHRPTFDQVGIHSNPLYNVGLAVVYDEWTYYGKVSWTNFNGSTKLSEEMITHGITLGEGTDYKMHTPTQFISFGAKRKFVIDEKFSISPLVEIDFQRTSYTWSATGNGTITDNNTGKIMDSIHDSRGYFNLWSPAIGLELEYNFTPNTSLIVLGKGIIPVQNRWKYYFYGSAKVQHTFFTNECSAFNELKGYIGIEAYTSKMRDHQEEMQNWIEITQAPMVTAGFIINIL